VPAGPCSLAVGQLRTARLLFDRELTAGTLDEQALQARRVRSATRVRGVPPRPVRIAQQVLHKLGRLSFERYVVNPLVAARRTVLGDRAPAPPRFLVRVDEFPHYRAWDDLGRFGTRGFMRFHEIMAAAGIPYLLAVLPRVSREPLSPAISESRALEQTERAMLRQLAADGVAFGLHGRDHRSRFASPRRHSELSGLSVAQTEKLLDEAIAELLGYGIAAEVFVPPYNRFDSVQLSLLARRFAVVCGGPESVGTLGFQRTPQWRDGTVYLPAYPPFYGTASQMLAAAGRAIERRLGLWVPVVLHWGWEAEEGWRGLERLAGLIAPHAASWDDFLAAVARSRETPQASSADRATPAAQAPPMPKGES
jgi:peptidoglycan/xylan/chitin deacetylase (PgdA/CDA1 family)